MFHPADIGSPLRRIQQGSPNKSVSLYKAVSRYSAVKSLGATGENCTHNLERIRRAPPTRRSYCSRTPPPYRGTVLHLNWGRLNAKIKKNTCWDPRPSVRPFVFGRNAKVSGLVLIKTVAMHERCTLPPPVFGCFAFRPTTEHHIKKEKEHTSAVRSTKEKGFSI